jgi:iron complex outermembrane receptor protein
MKSTRIVVSITTLAAAVAAVLQPAIAADDNGLEEIVVTARKRSEDILKTPIAVSALTSEDIEVRGIKSVNDLVNSTPGLNVSNVNSGRSDRSFQQITLRGFVPTLTTVTLTSTFIDGVPVASASALNNVTDPERIEILKGPQAAYFGRNTFAGAVNVVNKLPANEFGGSVSALAGTRDNRDVALSIEGPIAGDLLGFRLTGRAYSKSGSYRNYAAPAQTLGDQSTTTGTLLLVSKPVSGLTIKAFGLLSKDDDGPSAQGQISSYEIRSNNGVANLPFFSGSTAGTVILPSLSNCTLSGFTNGRSATEARVQRPWFCGAAPGLPAGFSPSQNTTEDALLAAALRNGTARVYNDGNGVRGYGLIRDYRHLHLNVDYEFGDSGFTLSSLTGYNNEMYSELADLDNYDSTLLKNPVNATNADPNRRTFWDFMFLVERNNSDFSQEFRLDYDKRGPFTGVVGVSKLITRSRGDAVSITADIVGPGARTAGNLAAPQRAETLGAFFGLNYQITDALKASVEGRYQQDKVSGYAGGAGLTLRQSVGSVAAGFYPALSKVAEQKFNNFLPRAIVQYDFSPDLMAYGSYSKGVNVVINAFNTNPFSGSTAAVAAAQALGLGFVVKPEKLDNFEVGLKGKALDGRLRGSLSAYYAKWKDQLNSRSAFFQDIPVAQGGTGTIQTINGIANSGEVVLKGLELDVTYRPIGELELSLAASYNDSDVRAYADPLTSQVTGQIGDDFKGHQLQLSSKLSTNFGVQYGGTLPSVEDSSWFVRGDYSWKDKQYLDVSNVVWIKARSLVNLRAGIGKGPLGLEAYVYNAFNDKNYTAIAANSLLDPTFTTTVRAQGVFGYLNVGLPDLRTYGLKATYKF